MKTLVPVLFMAVFCLSAYANEISISYAVNCETALTPQYEALSPKILAALDVFPNTVKVLEVKSDDTLSPDSEFLLALEQTTQSLSIVESRDLPMHFDNFGRAGVSYYAITDWTALVGRAVVGFQDLH